MAIYRADAAWALGRKGAALHGREPDRKLETASRRSSSRGGIAGAFSARTEPPRMSFPRKRESRLGNKNSGLDWIPAFERVKKSNAVLVAFPSLLGKVAGGRMGCGKQLEFSASSHKYSCKPSNNTASSHTPSALRAPSPLRGEGDNHGVRFLHTLFCGNDKNDSARAENALEARTPVISAAAPKAAARSSEASPILAH